MQDLRQSTAATVHVGPFLDPTDGVTPVTNLAAGTVDEIGVYKDAGTALVDISGTTTFTHRAGGIYTLTLSTSDTATAGSLLVYVRDDSAALPVWKECEVVTQTYYDHRYSTGSLTVDLTAQAKLDVNAECDTALADYDAPTKTELDAGFNALNDLNSAEVNAAVDTALADYDGPTKAELDTAHATTDALITALNDLSAAQINAEVVDAISSDTYGEPSQGTIPVSGSLISKINYLYKIMRNKIEQTSTELRIYDDAGTTVDHKATVSDSGTLFTRGEIISGP